MDDGAGNAGNRNNGQVDAGEQPVQSGVLVELLDGNGNPVLVNGQPATTTTDANGYYRFDNLPAGQYQVRVAASNFAAGGKLFGYASSNGQNTDFSSAGNNQDHGDNPINPTVNGVRSTLVTLGASNPIGEVDNGATGNASHGPSGDANDNLTVDFGFFATASIGDYAWLDTNKNGLQDADETPVQGVKVEIFNADGTPVTDAYGNPAPAQVTGADGKYLFTNLNPGDYYVQFTPPANLSFSLPDQGNNDAVDSDANPATGRTPVTTLTTGEQDLTWDAGFHPSASLGNYVWYDMNGNGVRDADEPPLSGVTVTLYDDKGNTIGTTQTDQNGFYSFSGLTPGSYVVGFTPPSGYVLTQANQGDNDNLDSDASPLTQRTQAITLGAGENNPTLWAGLTLPAALGSYVWNDGAKDSADGIKAPNELVIPNVTVILLDSSQNEIARTVTDGQGLFHFTNLSPGDYYLKFIAPNGMEFTQQVTSQADTNSDANPTTGETAIIHLGTGITDNSWGSGFVGTPTALEPEAEPNASNTHIYLPIIQNQTHLGRSGFKTPKVTAQPQTLDQIVEEYWNSFLQWWDSQLTK